MFAVVVMLAISPVFLVCAILMAVWVLGFPLHKLLIRWQMLDRPNERSSHDRPTVRGGGISFMSAAVVGMITIGWSAPDRVAVILAISASALGLVSLVDDFKSLSPSQRFGFHALAAVMALWSLGWPTLRFEIDPNEAWQPATWVGLAVGFLWIAGYTNAFNFMDGINGIAAGQAVGLALLFWAF